MFGKDFVIEQTANDRIVFEKLKKPQKQAGEFITTSKLC